VSSTFPEILLSIHMSSNRADQFVTFLDRLESSADEPSRIEVMAHIDDGDEMMHALTAAEAAKRRLRVSPVSRPRDGFYGLWKAFDHLLRATSPGAYFVVNFNDEMHFKERGWDTRLQKYVGLFPDHIFRLRTSVQRNRNYYDYWEAGFANDTSAIMTRRWLEVGGGWCPCNGPDTFQQTVAYYFGWLHRFNAQRPYRELAVDDLQIAGSGANHGLEGQKLRERLRGAIAPWFHLVSRPVQEEAARRAQLLHATIWAEARGLDNHEITDNRARRSIDVVERSTGAVKTRLSYRLSGLRIGLTNARRRLNYGYFGGGGDTVPNAWHNLQQYLALRYRWYSQVIDVYYNPRLRPIRFACELIFLQPILLIRHPVRRSARIANRFRFAMLDAYWNPNRLWGPHGLVFQGIRALFLCGLIWPARIIRRPLRNTRSLWEAIRNRRSSQADVAALEGDERVGNNLPR
jgi:hypothetical protein